MLKKKPKLFKFVSKSEFFFYVLFQNFKDEQSYGCAAYIDTLQHASVTKIT